MDSNKLKLEESWKAVLKDEFQKPYFEQIRKVLLDTQNKGIKTFPPNNLIFNAFDQTPFSQLKVVVIGQDPYHKLGQAMGLSFSVSEGIAIPPSLKNIYKELNRDLGIKIPTSGNLTSWAKQGVFLLNAILTVEENKARSHAKIGWEIFTDAIISKISQEKENIVFLLWGNFAKSKKLLIDSSKHFVLEAVHPSPLAGGKFVGCGHFSKTNEILKEKRIKEIDWSK